MAVKDWHPGQLVIFWIAMTLLWGVFLMGLIAVAQSGPEVVAGVGLIVVTSIIAGLALATTWKWFEGRKK